MKRRSPKKEAPGTRLLRMLKSHFPTVQTVVDATEPVRVTVTPKDISAAVKKKHNACVLAKACQRDLGATAAMISATRAFLVYGDRAVRYCLAEDTAREIIAFDRGGKFMPGTYTFQKPAGASRLGQKRGYGPMGKGIHKRKGFKLVPGIRAHLMGSRIKTVAL